MDGQTKIYNLKDNDGHKKLHLVVFVYVQFQVEKVFGNILILKDFLRKVEKAWRNLTKYQILYLKRLDLSYLMHIFIIDGTR